MWFFTSMFQVVMIHQLQTSMTLKLMMCQVVMIHQLQTSLNRKLHQNLPVMMPLRVLRPSTMLNMPRSAMVTAWRFCGCTLSGSGCCFIP